MLRFMQQELLLQTKKLQNTLLFKEKQTEKKLLLNTICIVLAKTE